MPGASNAHEALRRSNQVIETLAQLAPGYHDLDLLPHTIWVFCYSTLTCQGTERRNGSAASPPAQGERRESEERARGESVPHTP